MPDETTPAPKGGKAPKNFEAAMSELEKITERLESGEAPLDEVVAAYERGAALVKYCDERLRAARGKIQKLEEDALTGMDDVGE